MTLEVEVLDDPARACAAMLVGAAIGGGNLALTGGSTPGGAYQELAEVVRAVGLDLARTSVWFSDERCVQPDDERSNYGMAKQALLAPLAGVTEPTIHRMQGELGAQAGADAYERELRDAGPPLFDLVLLGIGPDGHLASLFPDQETLAERERLVVGVEHAGLEPHVPRISLTLPALAAANRVVFMATGESKADAVAAAFGPRATPDPHVPSSMLPPLARHTTVLLDPAAASRL